MEMRRSVASTCNDVQRFPTIVLDVKSVTSKGTPSIFSLPPSPTTAALDHPTSNLWDELTEGLTLPEDLMDELFDSDMFPF